LLLLVPLSPLFAQTKEIDSAVTALSRYEAANKGKTPTIKDTTKVNMLFNVAMLYSNGDPETSLKYANRQLALAEKIDFKYGIATGLNLLGTLHDRNGDYQKALPLYVRAISVFEKMGDQQMQTDVYNNIGAMYIARGIPAQALQYLLKSLAIAQKNKDDIGTLSAFNNIGLIYDSQRKTDLALKYYFKALYLQLRNKDNFAISYTYLNIAELYRKLKSNNARKYVMLGIQSALKEGDSLSIANNYAALGNIEIDENHYPKALELHNKAFAIRNRIQDGYGIFSSNVKLADIYGRTGEYRKARDYATIALKMVEEQGDLERTATVRQQLAEFESALGNYKAAYNHYQVFSKLNDSVYSISINKKMTELQMNYEFDKKQSEARALQRKKDADTAATAKRQGIINFSILAILVVVIGIAFLIYGSLRRNQKQKKLIEEQNSIIQQSLTEKETLLREIHHRVKNNLQIISSLLNIQSEDIQDANVLSSIQEGQSRVEAMSLIHQNLYQSEHLNNVDIENYIKGLVEYLSKMFRGDSNSVDVNIETSGIRFDIDTAIPLGLIVNELVSNAYKYAFDSNAKGSINISILAKNDTDYELNVTNDGKPLPADFDPKQSRSLGLKLVTILSRQLRGRMSSNSSNGITSFTVDFKDLKAWHALN
jgi:two-component sensor histidine kinase/Tfp pilus assembly protein PilF